MKLEKKFVTIGGGIGSFCYHSALRIHGVASNDIAVITPHKKPYHQFKIYCDEIDLDKLRSDSSSRPDNFWGFPGYGLQKAIHLIKQGEILKGLRILFQLFMEPFLVSYYCPTPNDVFKAINKEAKRTDWDKSLHLGKALSLSKLDNGQYEVRFEDLKSKKHSIIAEHVHLALGHGLSNFNANKNIFSNIKSKGGTVLVRGRGTSAARMIARLLEIKSKKRIEVVSLHRNELPDYADSRRLKQRQFMNWRIQQFNWPKSAFSGELMEKVREAGTRKYFPQWGLPSTTPDKKWISLINKSIKEGRYKIVFSENNIKADYIIDCTGFNENPKLNKFYHSLIRKYNLDLNYLGNIKTGRNFEIEKLCSYNGRVSISGVGSAGSFYGPVDSFFGHQFAVSTIIKNTPSIKPLSTIDSIKQWFKWVKNETI